MFNSVARTGSSWQANLLFAAPLRARAFRLAVLAASGLLYTTQEATADCAPLPPVSGATIVCSGPVNSTLSANGLSSLTVLIQPGASFNANPALMMTAISSLTVVNNGGNLSRAEFNNIASLSFENSGNVNQGVAITGDGLHTVINHQGAAINQSLTFSGNSNDTVVNQGFINPAIAKTGGGTLSVVNAATGFINQSINVTGSSRTSIDNAGIIQGGGITLGSGDDLIINRSSGTINGTVNQGAGADAFVMQGGRVNGEVQQGDGSDTASILGGEITQFYRGGTGNDELVWSGGLVGGIDMGDDTDTATLHNLTQDQLRNIEIDGGQGTNDTLIWDHTRGENPARLDNWELIELGNGSELTMNSDLTLGDSGTATGALTIDPTSTLLAGNGAHTVAPFTPGNPVAVANAGTIDLTNGPPSVSDSLRVVGNYVGQGGRLNLNSRLDSDGSPSDRLIIDGGTATGSTGILDVNLNGAGDVTYANGIMVVDAINGATTSGGAFFLANPGGYAAAGPYAYTLYRSSVDSSNPNAWYLRSTIDCATDPSNLACLIPPPGPPGPPGKPPNMRPETSLYAALPAMIIVYGRQILDTLHERMGQQAAPGSLAEGAPYAWGRVIGVHGEHEGDWRGILGDGPRYSYDMFALQVGMDAYRSVDAVGSRDRAGFFLVAGDSNGNVTHYDGRDAGNNNFQAFTLGGYWTYYAPSDAYLDAVLQGTWFDATAQGNTPLLSTGGPGVGASLEGGIPVIQSYGVIVEPQAQLVYQAIDLKTGWDTAATIDFNDVQSLIGRLGVRFAYAFPHALAGSPITAWVRPNVWYEFLGNPVTDFSSARGPIPFLAELGGSAIEINTGLTVPLSEMTSIYANASYEIGISENAGGNAYDGKLGIKVNW